MTIIEKTYTLKHTPSGFKLTLNRDENVVLLEEGLSESSLGLDALTAPRWSHWYQRKLARPWQATLLGMNIEPISSARNILRKHDKKRYQIFKDRLDILTTLIGYEINYFPDHLRAGAGAGENYIELSEYCIFAENLKWDEMHFMRFGLELDVNMPNRPLHTKMEENILSLLDTVLNYSVKEYKNSIGKRSPAKVINWLRTKDRDIDIKESTLRNWFGRMGGSE